MWLIVSGDGDLDYTRAFGPYDTEADATADLPADDDDTRWRVIELENPTSIIHTPELVDDTVAVIPTITPVPANPLDDLIDQYGAVENIPAPNPHVYTWANQQIRQVKNHIDNLGYDRGFFTPEEGIALAKLIGVNANNLLHNDHFAEPIRDAQAQLIFLEELARAHRPRAGF